jgi:tetratricopeptide (TPR) repeat protein
MFYRSSFRVFLLCTLALALLTATAAGQDHSSLGNRTSSITGSVAVGNAPGIGVQVDLTNALGQLIAVTNTSADGSFEFRDLETGIYFVRATAGLDEAREQLDLDSAFGTVRLRLPDSAANPEVADVGGRHAVTVAQLQVPSKARKAYRKAQDALRKGETVEALKHTERALQLFPEFADALTLRGILKLDAGDLTQASRDLDQAIKLDPKYAMAYIGMGAVFNALGHFDDALRVLDRGVALAPTSWQAFFELGRAQVGKGEFENAIRNLNKAEEFAPQVYPLIHLVRAHALLGLEQYDNAMGELQLYLTRSPSDANSESARRTLEQVKAFTAGSGRR